MASTEVAETSSFYVWYIWGLLVLALGLLGYLGSATARGGISGDRERSFTTLGSLDHLMRVTPEGESLGLGFTERVGGEGESSGISFRETV